MDNSEEILSFLSSREKIENKTLKEFIDMGFDIILKDSSGEITVKKEDVHLNYTFQPPRVKIKAKDIVKNVTVDSYLVSSFTEETPENERPAKGFCNVATSVDFVDEKKSNRVNLSPFLPVTDEDVKFAELRAKELEDEECMTEDEFIAMLEKEEEVEGSLESTNSKEPV